MLFCLLMIARLIELMVIYAISLVLGPTPYLSQVSSRIDVKCCLCDLNFKESVSVSPFRFGFTPSTSVLPSNMLSIPFNPMNTISSITELDCSLRVFFIKIPFMSLSVSISGYCSMLGICRLSRLTPSFIRDCFNSYMSSSRSERKHYTANGLF